MAKSDDKVCKLWFARSYSPKNSEHREFFSKGECSVMDFVCFRGFVGVVRVTDITDVECSHYQNGECIAANLFKKSINEFEYKLIAKARQIRREMIPEFDEGLSAQLKRITKQMYSAGETILLEKERLKKLLYIYVRDISEVLGYDEVEIMARIEEEIPIIIKSFFHVNTEFVPDVPQEQMGTINLERAQVYIKDKKTQCINGTGFNSVIYDEYQKPESEPEIVKDDSDNPFANLMPLDDESIVGTDLAKTEDLEENPFAYLMPGDDDD